MTTPNDAPAVSPSVNPASEPAAEPPVVGEGVQLSLKVRTLDQKTYPISICAAASVPQLKELVATETGITLARQRLIYRGRVLKNDQTLASYSLEDGHVLHLVVRAAPPPPPPPADAAASGQGSTAAPASDPNAGPTGRAPAPYQYSPADVREIDALNARLDEFERTSLRSRSRSRSRQRQRRLTRSPPPPPRDNDEPDPTMGRSGAAMPGRVLMGATIAVPEGAGVTMPFLSSMIANLVTQVSESGGGAEAEGGATTGTTGDGRHHVTFSNEVPGGGTAAEMEAATARALRHHHRNRDGSSSTGRQRTARRSSSSAERQVALRARTGLRLESVRATLNDTSLDFPAELTVLPQGDNNTAMSELQQQVEMLLTLLERFGPRLRLLPAALAQRDGLSERAATDGAASAVFNTASTGPTTASAGPHTASAEPPTVSAGSTSPATGSTTTPDSRNAAAAGTTLSARQVLCAIEALQTIGESTDLLARMARHAFVRQSMQLGEPISRRGNAATAGTTAGDRIQATLNAIQAGARTTHTARAGTTAGDRIQATLDPMPETTRAARTATRSAANMRPRFRVARISATDLLGERSSAIPGTARASPAGPPGLTPSFPVDLTGFSSGAVSLVSGSATSARNSQPTTQADAVQSDGNAPLPPAGAHISISGMGLPLMSSVVFPFSLAAGLGGSHATTTWNLADFVSRLTSELPISTLYGVMAGDATHLHHILAHVGFALFSGVDVPRVTRPSIRTWAQDLVGELRRLLRSHTLPADVVDQVTGTNERRSALGNELLRVAEPFIPDLVDFLVRATSASRAAAFGTSSATFLRTMAQQIVRQLGSYARDDSSESEDESDERLKRLLRGLLVWLGMNEHMATFVVGSLLCWTEGDGTGSRRGRTRQREEAGSEIGVVDSPATKRRRE